MKAKIIFLMLLVVCFTTPSLLSQQDNAQPAAKSPIDPAQLSQRVAAKARAVLAEVQKQVSGGNVRQDVIAKMEQYKPLTEAGNLQAAEALLDEVLKDLGVVFDPATIAVKPTTVDKSDVDGQQSDDSPTAMLAANRMYLLIKAQAAVEEFKKRVGAGDAPKKVADRLAKFDGLMQANKLKEAEELIDGALDELGIDPPPRPVKPPPPRKPPKQAKPPQQTKPPPKPAATKPPSRPVVDGPLPEFNATGFTKVFDGESLNDWEGDPTYWSVSNGKLVGTVTPATLLKKNSWILWRGGTVRDFELVLDYRVSAQGNSGIGYRLAVLDGEPFSVRGPQADIDGANLFTGICYEENGRRLLAAQGQSTWIDDPGIQPRLIGQVGDPQALLKVVRKEDWNRYRLIVKGTNAKHFINGVLMSEVHDFDDTNRMTAGLIGVQVHVGPPMKVEFRDIFLKHFGEAAEDESKPDALVYQPGDRLELDHSTSFENLAKQTAKLTAPVTSTRVNERDELDIVTRDVAFVRHGLQDVRLPGQAPNSVQKQAPGSGRIDLVVATPNFVVRVPQAGFRLLGQPFDRELRVRLKWDAQAGHYTLVDITAAEDSTSNQPDAKEVLFQLGDPADLRQTIGARLPAWADDVQTFIMTPVRPDRARDLHVSVNGAWGGVPGGYSILPHDSEIQREYNSDQKEFAAAVRDAGMIVPAAINTIEGLHTLRGKVANLDQMACRDAEGNLVIARQMVLMCSLNPDWVQKEIDTGKAAIDAGAQWILLDTPMGASFVSGYLKGGFCDHCMANFEAYLRRSYFGSELASKFSVYNFDRAEIISRLAAMQQVTPMQSSVHLQTTADARLFQEFVKCQEETNFATRKHVMESLYRYAKQQDKEVLFCTNAADLGAQNPGGHWIRGLQFGDLVDLFTYELNNEPTGNAEATQTRMPRGKWAAFHKLSYAVHGRRNPAVIHTRDSDFLGTQARQGRSSLAWMAAQAVEAYAANGAYIPFHVEIGSFGKRRMEKIWSRVFEHNRFIREHQDLYEGDLATGSSFAMLFLLNERGRTIPAVFPSYLGLAQGFVEANYQFDVVFAGDDRYVKDQLTAEQLESFESIIVPSPIHPTENQKRIVQQFAKSGGVVVCQEPELLGLVSSEAIKRSDEEESWWDFEFRFGDGTVRVLSGDVTPIETHDVGTQFYRQYTPDLRDKVAKIADYLGLQPTIENHRDGTLSAFTVVQPERRRVMVHVVNYDIDYEKDSIYPKQNIRVSIAEPDFLKQAASGVLYNCKTGMDVPITIEHQDGRLQFTIPEIDLGSVIEIPAGEVENSADEADENDQASAAP